MARNYHGLLDPQHPHAHGLLYWCPIHVKDQSNWPPSLDPKQRQITHQAGTAGADIEMTKDPDGKFFPEVFRIINSNDHGISSDQVPTELYGSAEMAWMMWYRPDTVTARRGIFHLGSVTNTSHWVFLIEVSDAGKYRVFVSAGNSDGGSNYAETGSGFVSNNQWQHFGFIFNGGAATDEDRLRLFYNGLQIPDASLTHFGTIPSSLNTPASASRLQWGDWLASLTSLEATGYFTEPRLYNYAVPDSLIVEAYHGVQPWKAPDLYVPRQVAAAAAARITIPQERRRWF